MKRIAGFLSALLLMATNVCAEEIQLTDYSFTEAKRMLDGYEYISYSPRYEYSPQEHIFLLNFGVENNILKPNGTLLYNSGDYNVMYYVDEGYFMYPQTKSGKEFKIGTINLPYDYDTSKENKTAYMNLNGEIITKFGIVGVVNNFDNYLFFSPDSEQAGYYNSTPSEKMIINTETGKNFVFEGGTTLLYNSDKDTFAVCKIRSDSIDIDFFKDCSLQENYKGNLTQNNNEYSNGIVFFDYNKLIYNGDEFVIADISFGDFYRNSKNDETDYIHMNYETEESESDRVDRSYTFKEKEVNGTKYYALFKELNEDETAADFAPTERPNEPYAENIGKMAADKLLFNNEQCFYDRGITKLDFGIVLGRVLCKAANYDIDNYISNTHFVDVNHPYCLLLADSGILTSDNDLYINEKAISQTTVLNSLDSVAKKYGVLSKWNSVKEISISDEECTRELAYSEIFKLYNIIKDMPNIDINTDFRTTNVDFIKIIYIGAFSAFILVLGGFFNNMPTQKNH